MGGEGYSLSVGESLVVSSISNCPMYSASTAESVFTKTSHFALSASLDISAFNSIS